MCLEVIFQFNLTTLDEDFIVSFFKLGKVDLNNLKAILRIRFLSDKIRIRRIFKYHLFDEFIFNRERNLINQYSPFDMICKLMIFMFDFRIKLIKNILLFN